MKKETTTILNENEMSRTIERLAYQVLEKYENVQDIIIVGIQRRGADIASRIQQILASKTGQNVAFGTLDINLYRDDWTSAQNMPALAGTSIPVAVEEKDIILVDDVLYTGRTIRAALEALLDFGRPRHVELLVLVDRGHRELPIHADYIGKSLSTAQSERVDVKTKERDGVEGVFLQ